MTHDAEGRLAAWLDTTSGQVLMPDHAAADLRAVLQALADTRDENQLLFVEAATEKSRRELFQDALAEVQAERARLRAELADTRQQLDEDDALPDWLTHEPRQEGQETAQDGRRSHPEHPNQGQTPGNPQNPTTNDGSET
jgi:hypothetical protein